MVYGLSYGIRIFVRYTGKVLSCKLCLKLINYQNLIINNFGKGQNLWSGNHISALTEHKQMGLFIFFNISKFQCGGGGQFNEPAILKG